MAAQPEEVSPEQIRERMADTRAAMTARLELLRAQATPRALLTRRLPGARHKPHDARPTGDPAADDTSRPGLAGTVYRQLRQRPVLVVAAVALLGAAAAVLLPGPRRR